MTINRLKRFAAGLVFLAAAHLWAQTDSTPPVPAVTGLASSEDRMLTPPPVSGESYPVSFSSEERSNYLRGGLTFSTAYSDNVIAATATPVSDISYSVWPTLALDKITPRLHWISTYAAGFTFYQRNSSGNEADQNASIDFQYRLSPHVTVGVRDGFQKTSNVFNQPDLLSSGAVSGGTQGPNDSIVAPIADRLSNSGHASIAFQFSANGMVGANTTLTNLHYPNRVPGLFDSSSQGGSVFYAHRVSKMHYIGVSYQYQRLLSYLTQGRNNETQTHSLLLLYTLYATSKFSISMFGGPQQSDVGVQFSAFSPTPQPGSRSWTPAAGASMNWQGRLTSLAFSYSHIIAPGGGLIGAALLNSANASLRQQLARALSASVSGGYAQNTVVGSLLATAGASSNGHTLSGTASLERKFGEHLNVQLGYTRLHQSYNVAAISATPDTNREFISLSYQFTRPLGR